MNMIINDLFYSLNVDPLNTNNKILHELYSNDPKMFNDYINNFWSLEYNKDISNKLNVEYKLPNYTQHLINNIFKEFSLLFHNNVDNTFFINRSITEQQINDYKLGSTHILENKNIVVEFRNKLYTKYQNEILINKIFKYHNDILQQNLKLFSDPHCSTIPSYDINGNCKGIVYRSNSFKKYNSLRNISKFFISHAPTYLFNYETIDKYNDLILVEGVFDVMALNRLGIKNVISASYTRISKYHYDILKNKNLFIIYDGDLGGLYGSKFIYETYKFNNISVNLIAEDIDEQVNNDPDFVINFLKEHNIKCYYE